MSVCVCVCCCCCLCGFVFSLVCFCFGLVCSLFLFFLLGGSFPFYTPELSSPGSTFCADSNFGIRSTPVLPQ